MADKIIAKGKLVAASAMEASAADIEYGDGAFKIVGTDRTMSLFDVAKAAKDPARAGGREPGLDDEFTRTPTADTFPNGCHICELEIDPDTGVLEIVNYSVMDDFGAALNPLLLQGQVHGGIGQGVGQALTEKTVYDKDSGQLAERQLPGLRPAARRRRAARCTLRPAQQPVHDQSAGREGRGRGRRHRRAAGGDQRHRRCDPPAHRREARRHAGDGGEPVGGDRRPSAEDRRRKPSL